MQIMVQGYINSALHTLASESYQAKYPSLDIAMAPRRFFIILLFVNEEQYSGGVGVANFVAFDAPIPSLPTLMECWTIVCRVVWTRVALIKASMITTWSQWIPGADLEDASKYIKQGDINGLYAYDSNDALSGDIGTGNGAWSVYKSVVGSSTSLGDQFTQRSYKVVLNPTTIRGL